MAAEASQTGPEKGIPIDPDYFSDGGRKPYVSSSELWWYTFLGLNHFAVNEPLWGIAKILTLGGMGLWWLWDLLFISSQPTFVQRNGFPTPFHIFGQRLFGQGAISAGEPSHRQKTSYGLWALSTFLAPFGLQALFEDKYPLFIRNAFMLLIIFVTGSIIVPWFLVDGIGSIGFGGWFVVILLAPILIWNSAITLVSWWSTVKVAFNKEALLKGGIHMTPETEGFLNGFRKDVNYLFGVVDPKMADTINNGWSAGGRQSSYYRDLFEPKTASEIEATLPPPVDPKNPPPGTETIMFWALASPIVGIWIEVIKPIIYYLVPGAQVAYKAQDTALAAMNTANKGMEAAQTAANTVSSVASLDPMAALKGFNPADAAANALKGFNPAEALKGLNPAEALKGLNPAEALKGLNLAEATKGLNPTEALKGINLAAATKGLNPTEALKGFNLAEATKGLNPTEALKFPGIGSLVGDGKKNIGNPADLVASAAKKRFGMTGGAREEPLSAESLVLGGTVAAILGAGALKLTIDYLMPT
jgi:hypothetical protein